MSLSARVLVALLLFATGSAANAQTAQQIVAGADRVRNPSQAFRSTTRLTEYVRGREKGHSTLVVYSKRDPATDQFRNLVEYVDPARDAGKRVLLDGKNLWFFDPASNQSVRISPRQRVLGQAAIGDVLTVNLSVDYKATLAGTETIEDASRQEQECWRLDLRGVNGQAVYSRIEYWVEQGNFYPIKAKFYSDSGRVLKVLYYKGFVERLGSVRPTEAIIIDAVDTSLVTVVHFDDLRVQKIPDSWFQRDYLSRLRLQ